MSTRYPQGKQRSALYLPERLRRLNKTVPTDPSRPMIFVGGVPQVVPPTDALLYAEQFGPLIYFDMPARKSTALHHGFCKLVFRRLLDAETFLAHPQGHFIGSVQVGASIWVSRDQHVSLREVPAENKLFFKFKSAVTVGQACAYFGRFGQVQQVEIKQNNVTQEKRDFGFVTFADSWAAQAVLSAGNDHRVSGHALKVFPSKLGSEVFSPKTSTGLAQGSSDSLMMTLPEKARETGNAGSQLHTALKAGRPNQTGTPGSQQQRFEQNMAIKAYYEAEETEYARPAKARQTSSSQHEQQPVFRQATSRAECHEMKPCSKLWGHKLISQNHTRADNLVFTVAGPSRMAHQQHWLCADSHYL